MSKLRLSEAKVVGQDVLQVGDEGGLISELYDPNSFHDSKATLGSPQAAVGGQWVRAKAGGGVRKWELLGLRVAAWNQGVGMV